MADVVILNGIGIILYAGIIYVSNSLYEDSVKNQKRFKDYVEERKRKSEFLNYKRYSEINEIIEDIPNNSFSEVKMLKERSINLYENGFYTEKI